MITKFLIVLFFIMCSAFADACEVYLPGHLVILGQTLAFEQSIKQTECSPEILQEINNTINSVEGKFTSFQFAEILKLKNYDVVVQPSLIQVQHLNHLVREQIMMPTGIQMRSSEAVNSKNYLILSPGDRVQVQCSGCLFGAQEALNVKVLGFDGTDKALIVKADFKKMVKAYRVLGFHPAFSPITATSLKEEFIESIPHTDLLTNLDTLHFFKVNKPIRSGELLRQSDLNAINLVRAGTKTDVIIENEHVRLKTEGISRSNGILGELVEVFHPQTNKKYLGKVIDLNKVSVEL
jgi:flagella basal body P-ring formation protein FlgA